MSAGIQTGGAFSLPDALTIGAMFCACGGSFIIAQDGKRQMYVPEDGGPKQRVIDALALWLRDLDDTARAAIFDAFAAVQVDESALTPSIEGPTRGPVQ